MFYGCVAYRFFLSANGSHVFSPRIDDFDLPGRENNFTLNLQLGDDGQPVNNDSQGVPLFLGNFLCALRPRRTVSTCCESMCAQHKSLV